jgi:hypothetical protein
MADMVYGERPEFGVAMGTIAAVVEQWLAP